MLSRREAIKSAAFAAAPPTAKRLPNFLFILCDQLNLDALSGYGNPWVRTPNIDRLVRSGISFMESHSPNPVCSPARSSLFTGRMTVETGVTVNSKEIKPGMPNMGQWFRQHGYETVYAGKWHLREYWPAKDLPGFTVLPTGAGEGSLVDPFTTRACASYLHTRKGSDPFVLVASLLQPHDICFWCIHDAELVPRDPPVKNLGNRLPTLPPNHRSRPTAPAALDSRSFKRFSGDQWRYYLYSYYRQVEMLDAEVGRLLDGLESSRYAADTIVIFTSDHGEGAARHQHVQKWYPYDEAMKVPLIVSAPRWIAGGRRDHEHLVSGIDIISTMCAYAEIPPPPHARGMSLRPLLENKLVEWRSFLVSEVQVVGRMLRTNGYKYVRYEGDPVEQFFDMKSDPWETTNRHQDASLAGVLTDHRKLLESWDRTLIPA